MKIRNLQEDFSVEAFWNLEGFENGIYGKVNYSQEEIILEFPAYTANIEETIENVIGTMNFGYISLFNLRFVSRKIGEFQSSKFKAEYMIINSKPIENINKFQVDELYFSFDYLPMFINKSSFSIKTNHEIEIIDVPKEEIKISELQATLTESVGCSQKEIKNSGGTAKLILENHIKLKLSYSDSQNILDVLGDIQKLQEIYSIFSGGWLTISSLCFPSEESNEVTLNGKKYCIPSKNGEFYFYQPINQRKMLSKTSASYNYSKLLPIMSNILNKFYKNYDKNESIIINICANLRYNNLVENQFFDAVTSLEELYRIYDNRNRDLPKDILDFNEYIKDLSIFKNLNKDSKKMIHNAIDEIHYESLKNKIKKQFSELPEMIRKKIKFKNYNFMINNDIKGFSYKCAQTRNFHAHGSKDKGENTFDIVEMLEATKVLNIVGEFKLMSHLEIPEQIIIDGILNKKAYESVIDMYKFNSPLPK